MKGKSRHTKIVKNHIGTWDRKRHPRQGKNGRLFYRLLGFELRCLGAKLKALGKLESQTIFSLFREHLLIFVSLFSSKLVQLFRRYGPLKFYSFLLISNPYFGIRHCSWTDTFPMLRINYTDFPQYYGIFLRIKLTLLNNSRVTGNL